MIRRAGQRTRQVVRAAAPIVAAAMVFLSSLTATAGNIPGQNTLVCDEIGQRRIVKGDRVTRREINFFLFDAAGRGCLGLVDRFLGEGGSIVARAPIEGFLHQTNTLDTLGVDVRETVCKMD